VSALHPSLHSNNVRRTLNAWGNASRSTGLACASGVWPSGKKLQCTRSFLPQQPGQAKNIVFLDIGVHRGNIQRAAFGQ
jgi:hypothetical protein